MFTSFRYYISREAVLITIAFLLFCGFSIANAEPYLAIQQGLKCMQCHVNPTGGGERTVYGEIFSQNVLPATHLDTGTEAWTGQLNSFISMGGNLRADATWNQVRNQHSLSAFDLDQARLYVSAAVIPDKLIFYVDELLGPGTSTNREAWGQLWFNDKTWYVKAGQIYLPFGFRLQDQSAFTRQVTGISMNTPDQGVEIGLEHGAWDAQLAITNGTVGGTTGNNGKEFTAQLAHVSTRWRVGLGGNINSSSGIGQVRAGTIFVGLHTGPVVWLAELDQVSSPINLSGSRITQAASLLEADWLIRSGHNLKLTAEFLDPDHKQSNNARQRLSLIYEFTPIQFFQLRLGYRHSDSDEINDALHTQQAFAEFHTFF